jgi:hypothetical protein
MCVILVSAERDRGSPLKFRPFVGNAPVLLPFRCHGCGVRPDGLAGLDDRLLPPAVDQKIQS